MSIYYRRIEDDATVNRWARAVIRGKVARGEMSDATWLDIYEMAVRIHVAVNIHR